MVELERRYVGDHYQWRLKNCVSSSVDFIKASNIFCSIYITYIQTHKYILVKQNTNHYVALQQMTFYNIMIQGSQTYKNTNVTIATT